MRRFWTVFICSLLLINLIMLPVCLADDINEGKPDKEMPAGAIETTAAAVRLPVVNAGAAIVMDCKSGRILYQKNAFSKRAIASTTKIMTAIIAIERGDPKDLVTVSKRAASVGGSSIDLKEGEQLTLKELLYGLMLNSGNDAAIAIGEHIGGSVEQFVEMMNEKAEELGVRDTCFQTPHGLDKPEHYSTAYDLALITRYALLNPTFAGIVGTKTASITGRSLYNTNEMLGFYQGADGVKTGYTGQAGRCLVTSASRDGMKLVSVVLGCSTRTIRAQSTKLVLDYAYNNYKLYNFEKAGKNIGSIEIIKGIAKKVDVFVKESITIPLTQEEKASLERVVMLPQKLKAPVFKDNDAGMIRYTVNGEVLGGSVIGFSDSVRQKTFKDYLKDIVHSWMELIRPDTRIISSP